ncbi:MAG: peptidase MA family metallohydrolase [candidate division Zixibacteria bacterium]
MPAIRIKARNLFLGFCFIAVCLQPDISRADVVEKGNFFRIIPSDDIYADSARYYLDYYQAILSDLLDSSLDTVISVYIAISDDEFRRWVGSSLPDWGAGVALPERGIIVIKSPKYIRTGKTFRELLGHELTHIMLHRASDSRWLPRWIHEGLAIHVSGEWNIGQDILVARATWTDNLIHLQGLENLTEFNGAKANLAYTESYLAVSSLLESKDKYVIADLLNLYRHNRDFHKSFRQAVGTEYVAWITDWYERTSMKYHFLLFIFDSKIIWLMVPVLFILLFIYKKRQNKKVKRRWKREEKLNPPGDEYKQYYDGYYDEENQV